jgi:hypothetical protein
MRTIKEVFGVDKPIIGMLHLSGYGRNHLARMLMRVRQELQGGKTGNAVLLRRDRNVTCKSKQAAVFLPAPLQGAALY